MSFDDEVLLMFLLNKQAEELTVGVWCVFIDFINALSYIEFTSYCTMSRVQSSNCVTHNYPK